MDDSFVGQVFDDASKGDNNSSGNKHVFSKNPIQNEFSPFAHSLEHRRKSNISWCSTLKSCTRDVQTGAKNRTYSHLLPVFRQFRLRTYLLAQLCAVATMLNSGSFNPCHATHVFHSASLPVPGQGLKHGKWINECLANIFQHQKYAGNYRIMRLHGLPKRIHLLCTSLITKSLWQ